MLRTLFLAFGDSRDLFAKYVDLLFDLLHHLMNLLLQLIKLLFDFNNLSRVVVGRKWLSN